MKSYFYAMVYLESTTLYELVISVRWNFMEKEKNKGKPNQRKQIIVAIILLVIAYLVGSCSYYIYPGHSLSYFSRFETAEEVVAFLHEDFDLYVTTSDEVLTFMEAYPLEYGECRNHTPGPGSFANYVVDEDIINIIICTVPKWYELFVSGYEIRFYINSDDLLEYISAKHLWLSYL